MSRIVVTVPAQIEGLALTSGAFLLGQSGWRPLPSRLQPQRGGVRIEEPNLRPGTERFTATAAMPCLPLGVLQESEIR